MLASPTTAARVASPKAKAAKRAESRTVKVGFIPLLDIAVLVAAAEMGFAAAKASTSS